MCMMALLASPLFAQEKAGEGKAKTEKVKAEKVSLVKGHEGTIAELNVEKKSLVISVETGKVTVHVTPETKLMKEGESVSLDKFKVGDAVVFGFKPRSKTDLSFLADKLSYIAFIRRKVVEGEVVSFDRAKGELKLKSDGQELTIGLTKVTRYFLNGKQLKAAEVELKPGSKVYVGYSSTGMAYAVFDKASWETYAKHEMQMIEVGKKRVKPKEGTKPHQETKTEGK